MDWLFFRRVRQLVGDDLKVIVWGGAPLAKDVLDFIGATFSCPVSCKQTQ